MRPTRWMLIGLLVIGGALLSDADEQKRSEGPQGARFERLLKQRPNDPALHYNLGTVRYRQGHYDKAAESLSTAVASSGSSLQGRASYNLGSTHYRLGRAAEHAAPNQALDFYQKALEDYRFAIRQDPKDADAKYNYELVDQHLKALKAQQAQQQSAKREQQQANQPSAQTQQEKAQSGQSEQAKEELGQQPQGQQQQTGSSSESQQQQAASAESKSEPESKSSTEAAHSTDQEQQGQQAQAVQQPSGQQESERNAQTATEPQNMSQQQAFWILDTLKNEERGALVNAHEHSAHEADVEQDW